MNIGETRQNPKNKWSILIHQGRAEWFWRWFPGQKMVLFQSPGSVLQMEGVYCYRVRTYLSPLQVYW